MKIGIMTFWCSEDNYGQQLQAFALQKYLRDEGHDAFLIRYNCEKDIGRNPLALRVLKAFNPVKLLRYLSYKKGIADSLKEIRLYSRHFEDFRKKYIKFYPKYYSSFVELKANPPEADCYIVGSDQVWNFGSGKLHIIKNRIHAYFLDFGNSETMRISYAASWGRGKISENEKNEIESLLQKFSFVTVREKSGIDLCLKCGFASVKLVCDPTLLLDVETYRSIYQNEKAEVPTKPYVLFYYLNNGGTFDKMSVWKFAQERGLEVQYITANACLDKYEKNFATVPEWIALVNNARYVITNSFHCCIFCILFCKQFGAIKLDGTNSGMNSRLENLFEITGCGERYVTDNNFSVLDKAYSAENEFKLKKESKLFIKEVVNG